jgi:SAM-dependent methyltransferase
MSEHTGASYEAIAGKYAETVDAKPWNAHYERPAVVSLLPALENTKVLDVGCGSGWYAEYLLEHGAAVTAFDLNAEFVALTQGRVGARAKVFQADFTQVLDFAHDEEFDLAICPLVMHYLKDWRPAFCEIHRILKPSGLLIFSTHHPFMDWKLFNREDYFALEKLEDEWDIGKVQFYRRPLTAMSDDLDAAGFCIERLLEPQPTEAFRCADIEGYERLMKNPWFLVVRARKTNAVQSKIVGKVIIQDGS